MVRKLTREQRYRLEHPYHVWVYTQDGRRFIGHFKNKRDASSWQRGFNKNSGRIAKLGNVSNRKVRKINRNARSELAYFGLPKVKVKRWF